MERNKKKENNGGRLLLSQSPRSTLCVRMQKPFLAKVLHNLKKWNMSLADADTLPSRYIHIYITTQTLKLIENNTLIDSYQVSTAKNGVGEQMGSACTPRGWHKIRAKIGDQQPLNSVFVRRRTTGEIYNLKLSQQYPQRDWVLTRILWLGGMQPGFNRYGLVDSTWRYIYIHGCPDHLMQGRPESHGCIRMYNVDIVNFFKQINIGDLVYIH